MYIYIAVCIIGQSCVNQLVFMNRRSVGETSSVDTGERAGGTGHSGEGQHKSVGESHRAHCQAHRQIFRC